MPSFSDITVVGIHGDGEVAKFIPAVEMTAERLAGSRKLLLTDKLIDSTIPQKKIGNFDSVGYQHFVLYCLYQFIETDYVLIVPADDRGFDPSTWRDEWFQYDYVGGLDLVKHKDLSQLSQAGQYPPIAGNGGLSLRSKHLLDAPTKYGVTLRRVFDEQLINETVQLCWFMREDLECKGLRFAPYEESSLLSFGDPPMAKSLFIVTSAIHTRFGVYSADQRLKQTLESFETIRRFCNADIIMVDAGQEPLSKEEEKQVLPYITDLVQFSGDPTIQRYQKIDNWDVVKNLIEITTLKVVFEALTKKTELPSVYRRVFKLSGRYLLNDTFSEQRHLAAVGKVAIKKSTPHFSDTDHWVIQETAKQYYRQHMTRCWSFDSTLLPYITETYAAMLTNLLDLLNNNRFIDIEHLMYCHLDPTKVEGLNVVGVQGNIAPNGMAVVD